MNENREANNQEQGKRAITENVMLYPSERVVSFFARSFPNKVTNADKNALDIGFGSGRHLKLMLDYNFQTYGVDYVEECAKIAKQLLGCNPNLKDLMTGDFSSCDFLKSIPYGFDAIVLWGVIFLRTRKEIADDLKLINNIMKKSGKLFLNFRTKENSFFKKGKMLEEGYTYIIDCKGYENTTYTFLDIADIENMMQDAGFNIEGIEKEEYWKNSLQDIHSWWLVTASKK